MCCLCIFIICFIFALVYHSAAAVNDLELIDLHGSFVMAVGMDGDFFDHLPVNFGGLGLNTYGCHFDCITILILIADLVFICCQ